MQRPLDLHGAVGAWYTARMRRSLPAWCLATSLLFALSLVGCGGAELTGLEPANPSFFEPTAMPPCGTALASWNGTTAYSNGPYTATGTSCAGVGSYGERYQCVELVMRHFSTKWGLRWWGNAKDLLVNAPRDRVDVYGNGDRAHPPVPGDMLVWTSGTWGHVALITGVRAGAVDILEQNINGSGVFSLPWDGATVGSRWGGAAPAGWAHAKANGGGGGGGGARCDALGYAGTCVGRVSVWAEGAQCKVRDCGAEGKSCGFISPADGYGCLGGTTGAVRYVCESFGYAGACLSNVLFWVEGGQCKYVDCAARGKRCGDAGGTIGKNCL